MLCVAVLLFSETVSTASVCIYYTTPHEFKTVPRVSKTNSKDVNSQSERECVICVLMLVFSIQFIIRSGRRGDN